MNFTLNHLWFQNECVLGNDYSELLVSSIQISKKEWRVSNYNKSIISTDEFEDCEGEKLQFLPNFKLVQNSSVSNFFTSNMIDIPKCLKNSYSLYKPIFELPHLKFLNILMRRGYKEKIYTTVLRLFIKSVMHPDSANNFNTLTYSWVALLPFFNSIFLSNKPVYNSLKFLKVNMWDGKSVTTKYLSESAPLVMSNFLVTKLERYKPTFLFKVQKVDKSTRKHSRGKSGKYVILWKYVPVYRRLYAVLRWLVQDIKFQKAHKFELKFLQSLNLLLSSSHSSLIIKFRNFNHNFVFKNFKKTLLKTLCTVS